MLPARLLAALLCTTLAGAAQAYTFRVPVPGLAVQSAAQVQVAPLSLSFGSVETGSSSAKSVVLTNAGQASAALGTPSVSSENFVISGNSCGTSLGAGQSCTVDVTFSPSAAGDVSGALSIPSSAENLSVSLVGKGAAPLSQNVYVSSEGSSLVLLCKADPSTGNLTACQSTGSGFSSPRQLAVANGYLYAANYTSHSVTACAINADDTLSNCQNTSVGNSPWGVAVYGSTLLVGDQTSNKIYRCSVSGSTLSGCAVATTQYLSNPLGLTLSGSNLLAANYSSGRVPAYALDSGGNVLSASLGSASGISGAAGVTLTGAATSLVSAFNAGTIYVCNGNPNLSSCTAAASVPSVLSTLVIGNWLYATSLNSNTVYRCSYSGGALSGCAANLSVNQPGIIVKAP